MGESDDQSQDDQRRRPVGPGHERRDDRADAAEQHPYAQRGLAAVLVGEHAARHLRDYVAPEKRAQDQPLRPLAPAELHRLEKRNVLHVTRARTANGKRFARARARADQSNV